MIELATIAVSQDEPCFGLYELDYNSGLPLPEGGFHRYQIILVIRDDKQAEAWIDMGSAVNWESVDQFRIPGGVRDPKTGRIEILHTVAELRGIADFLRVRPVFDKRELGEYNSRENRVPFWWH